MKQLILASLTLAPLLSAMDKHCDLIGDNKRGFKTDSGEICWGACSEDRGCLGAVFISSWNKCFLKSKIKRKASLRLFSEKKGDVGNYDQDFSAKDMKRLVVANVKNCRDACLQNQMCSGFTYLEGYRDCWLKKGSGRLFPKVFFCKEKVAKP